MQYYIEMYTNVAMAGITASVTAYCNAHPGLIVISYKVIHDGVNFQCALITKY